MQIIEANQRFTVRLVFLMLNINHNAGATTKELFRIFLFQISLFMEWQILKGLCMILFSNRIMQTYFATIGRAKGIAALVKF